MNLKNHFDVIIVGVGTMGAPACYFLAKQGYRVLGIEQFNIPHERGSHHGQSRIIRKAYFEHPGYVPLLERAYQNWEAIEQETGEKLYYQTGILYMGIPDEGIMNGVKLSAEKYNIPLEDISAQTLRQKYKVFQIPADYQALREPDAGFLTPEKAIRIYHSESLRKKAQIMDNETVIDWRMASGNIIVKTDRAEYYSDRLVLTAGAWMTKWLQTHVGLQVTKQMLAWMDVPANGLFDFGHLPCWFIEDKARGTYYGFPVLPGADFGYPSGFKLALHKPGQSVDPNHVNTTIPEGSEADIRHLLSNYIPSANRTILKWKHCLYTSTPDTHFILDHLPGTDRKVAIAGGFSGHGFKFASVIGEILADFVIRGKTELPVGFLSLSRFKSG